MQLKREIFSRSELYDSNDQFTHTLSYLSDVGAKQWHTAINPLQKTVTNQYKDILAIGNGSSYIYPHALFVGQSNGTLQYKQVYPPITLVEFRRICGTNTLSTPSSNVFYCDNYNPIGHMRGEQAYILPGTFLVTYATNMSNTYTTVAIPSFDPRTQSNNSRWAYYSSTRISIKDPALTKYIPSDYIESNTLPTDYFTYLKIRLNDDMFCSHSYVGPMSNLGKTNRQMYETTYTPLAYTIAKNGSTEQVVMRRQCTLSDENTTFITYRETINNPSTYNIFKIYYKGQLLTNISESLAYIMPKWGIGGTKVSGQDRYYNGSDPTYIYYDKISNPSSSQYGVNHDTMNDHGHHYDFTLNLDDKRLFNLFLIKVTGNENMNAFGQFYKYHNFKQSGFIGSDLYSLGGDSWQTPNGFTPIQIFPVTIANAFGDPHIVEKNYANTPSFIANSDNPIRSTKINSIYNNLSNGSIASPSISFRYNNYLNQNVVSEIKYMSYQNARTFVDVNNITYSFIPSTGDGVYASVTININTPPSSYIQTITPNSSTPTYTYCYLAADCFMRRQFQVVCNRVLSSTYLCIKRETVAGAGTSTTTWTTFIV